ncbi:hypothetical protein PCASD_10924 [Puccinia coronata f. sp. avenae]|uniref:Uncharacterized protein n=1 Tax=Puccinia coronata f. sp. avenae TaxID=200324 RepID=A0A2N5RV04_9BASI|nr:hypothetical protein PCASD_25357 [Puccinia coronata f. sp. avenae]PLW29167.1 hypothetical protein PCASD_10924 [Puccinia coronata f. sp. avenae]
MDHPASASTSAGKSSSQLAKKADTHSKSDKSRAVEQPIPDSTSSTTAVTTASPSAHIQPSSKPLACGRRRRHTISNNHIEFMFYHCLRDDIDEEDEDEQDDEEEEDSESSYHRISPRRQDQSLLDLHHCDVIVLKTDNGWCFDQDIFLPAWKRDAYEAAGQEDGFSGQELVKVDEIRVD